jgi:hypothetical protein
MYIHELFFGGGKRMNNKTIGGMILVVFVFFTFIFGQEEKSQKIELPHLTLEYKLCRSVINLVGAMIGGIAYAKSKGDRPEDFAPYCTYIIAGPWWKDKDFSYYVSKWYRIFSTDVDFKMEILNETESGVDVKMNIFGEKYIETYAESDVTREEYIRFLGAMLSGMAEYMGFQYKQKIEEDWIYFTIAKK